MQAIESWKEHQIRSLQRDKARITVLERLDETSVLITRDWAMKWLPQKYRETQADWFGKRGFSWHISVVVRRIAEDHQQQTFELFFNHYNHTELFQYSLVPNRLPQGFREELSQGDFISCSKGTSVLSTIPEQIDIR